MALDTKSIGEALANLFPPNKRTAPKEKEVEDTGCPTPPEGWEDVEPDPEEGSV